MVKQGRNAIEWLAIVRRPLGEACRWGRSMAGRRVTEELMKSVK
jgi:hypothetical protein